MADAAEAIPAVTPPPAAAAAAVAPTAQSTVTFALGSYVAMKLLESLGNYLTTAAKAHIKTHTTKIIEKHKKLITKKAMIVTALGVTAAAAGYYFWKKQKAKEAAANAASVQPSGEEMIASAMPDFKVTLW